MNIKTIIKVITTIIGLALIVNATFLAFVSNFNAGQIITLLSGLLLLLYVIQFQQIQKLTKNGILKWIKYCSYWAAAFVLAVIGVIAVYGNYDTVTYNEDALTILGAGIKGEAVTYPLMHRLNKAVEYANKNHEAFIIVSGGQGPQEDITEALAMERYLVNKGIPKERIIREERSTSTFENFKYSKQILDGYFDKSYNIAFVTNDFHVYRASQLAKIASLNSTHMHAKIEWYTISVSYLREFTAVIKLWVFKR